MKIAAVSEREDAAELIVIRKEAVENGLKFSFKKNAKVGTSSARRKSQLLAFRDDIIIEELRGNVPTRIQKLRDKKYDAIMLAAAGVERLRIDLSEFKVVRLDPKEFIPAPAQGVLGLQIREDDHELFEYINKLNSEKVEDIIGVERKVLNLFDGGCQLPLGIYCIKEDNKFKVWASKSDAWNTMPKRLYFESFTDEGFAEKIVNKLNTIKRKIHYTEQGMKPFNIQLENYNKSKEEPKKQLELDNQTKPSWDHKLADSPTGKVKKISLKTP